MSPPTMQMPVAHLARDRRAHVVEPDEPPARERARRRQGEQADVFGGPGPVSARMAAV